jgi:hypothetical protein
MNHCTALFVASVVKPSTWALGQMNLSELAPQKHTLILTMRTRCCLNRGKERMGIFSVSGGQAFAVFLPVKSVSVMGDGRTYDYVVALRAVVTSDFMTAHWAELPYSLLGRVSNRIINEVRHQPRGVRCQPPTPSHH